MSIIFSILLVRGAFIRVNMVSTDSTVHYYNTFHTIDTKSHLFSEQYIHNIQHTTLQYGDTRKWNGSIGSIPWTYKSRLLSFLTTLPRHTAVHSVSLHPSESSHLQFGNIQGIRRHKGTTYRNNHEFHETSFRYILFHEKRLQTML